MQNVLTIGKRLIPLEQIALVEPFDPASNPDFKTEKPFKARLVLITRDTVLTEDTPEAFAEAHGFRLLPDDQIAANPGVAFRVETFSPTESFKPDKPFATRLKWRDPDGNEQSKLLLAPPETVIATVVRNGAEPDAAPKPRRARVRAPRRARRLEAAS
jgi:hypothetical protein